MSRPVVLPALALLLAACGHGPTPPAPLPEVPAPTGPGNVIFIHPDGTGLAAWNAYRLIDAGPDGLTQWDQMPRAAFYRSHVLDSIASTSHAGGTIHGYGVKVLRDSYGRNGASPLTSASGRPHSLMTEALLAGLACGIINSGHLAEPGTGAQLASVDSRADHAEIARQLVESRCHVILGGGEVLFLPAGTTGRHGRPGTRSDGKNLVERAKELGYSVVYNRGELAALPDNTSRVLGLFAAENTYNDLPMQELLQRKLTPYDPNAPSTAEMAAAALRFLSHSGRRFFLMAEEEGTDNFANVMNAAGLFEAYRRADALLGTARAFVRSHDDTLLLMASDSEASGLHTVPLGLADAPNAPKKVPAATDAGSILHGQRGPGTEPFLSAPDRTGRRFLFAVSFASSDDLPGGVVARADGYGAGLLPLNLDNTGIFTLIHRILFAP
jgi:alkaline phosphatase